MFPTNNPFNNYPQASQIQVGQLPSNGRLTMPVGTFLSNPSTANDGIFGANGGALNVPQVGSNQVGTSFGDWLKDLFSPKTGRNVQGGGNMGVPQVLVDKLTQNSDRVNKTLYGQQYGEAPTPSQPGILNPPTTSAASSPLVGQDYSTPPTSLNSSVASSLFPGRSQDEIKQLMESKGYTFSVTRNGGSFSGVWTLTNPQKPVDNPNQFYSAADVGASLERGQRFEFSKGVNIVGGTPTTKDIGNTPAGTAQYAVTYGTVNKQLEAKGAYKWQSYTTKDANGNWVRVYQKVLRGAYTNRGHGHGSVNQNGKQAKHAVQPQQSADTTGLVTMRAAYG